MTLWPDPEPEHAPYIDDYVAGDRTLISQVYILETDEGEPIGFIELFVRNYADGTISTSVPYVEGWYVDERFRERGGGKLLMERAKQWAREQGSSELASDAEITNQVSIRAHKALGFREIDRNVTFLMDLGGSA